MRKIFALGLYIVFLLLTAQLAAGQQWPIGDWSTKAIFTNDHIHRAEAGATIDGNMLTIKAGGNDVGGIADQFTYVYKEISGDFEVWATVRTLENTDDWAKAGIMARQGLNTGAKNVMVASRGANDLVLFQRREVVNGNTSSEIMTTEETPRPVTIRLIRKGNEFTAGWSLDGGKTWGQGVAEDEAVTVEMRDPILLGIAVTSHALRTITTAEVEIGPPPPSPPPNRTMPEASLVSIETEQTVSKGDLFTAAINIRDVGGDLAGVGTHLRGFRLCVSFDPDILEVVQVDEGSLLSGIGETYWSEPNIDNTKGVITCIKCDITGQDGTDVGGTLATITFKAIGIGTSYVRSVGRSYTTWPNIELHDSRWKPVIVISSYNRVMVYDSTAIGVTELSQNYPNPFNPETWVPYQLAEDSGVTIRIYNSTGRLVRLLDLGYRSAGSYVTKDSAAYWDGMNDAGERVASGLYFYSIQAGRYNATRKMIVSQ